ncbi:MAG: hypothetical protein AB7I38_04015 [Dehalococcoidia bacterium]
MTVLADTCIDGTFEGWSGETLFPLCDGTLWIQADYSYQYTYAFRPRAIIASSGGQYFLLVEGVDEPVPVLPVTNFVRSCIDGNFEGWDGDTIFPLCNGQVWQQSAFAFHFHFAFRPAVIVYASPFGGFRLKVDGVDQTIRVIRIR